MMFEHAKNLEFEEAAVIRTRSNASRRGERIKRDRY
jgi:hypothetical protein